MLRAIKVLLRSLSANIWAATAVVFVILPSIFVQRIADRLVPPGTEETVFTRIVQRVEDILTAIPTEFLAGAAAMALTLYVWDERVRLLLVVKNFSRKINLISGQATKDKNTPLREAAVSAYEKTKDGWLGKWAENEGGANEVITWYCYYLAEKIAFYGYRVPSRIPEKLPENFLTRYSIEIQDEKIVAKERDGSRVYKDLHVISADLSRALDKLVEFSEILE